MTATQFSAQFLGSLVASVRRTSTLAQEREHDRLNGIATTKRAPGPIPSPTIISTDGDLDARTLARWNRIVAKLPARLREVIEQADFGFDMQEISEALAIPLVEVWDRALEVHAEVLKAAGLPVTNPKLEDWLKNNGLLPLETRPFPCDIGWVIRNLPRRMREGIYARIMCRGIEVPHVWGMKIATFNNRWRAGAGALGFYALAAGALTPPTNSTKVPDWRIGCVLGISIYACNKAAKALGFPEWTGPYTWSQVKEMWPLLVQTPEYRRYL